MARKKSKSIPLSGNVTLSTMRSRIDQELVLEQYFGEDGELVEVTLEDKAPTKSTKVPAKALWALLYLAVEGAVESVDPDDYDDEETDEWGLMPDQEDRLRSNLQRLREDYLTDRVFVGLMNSDVSAACHWYWDAVVQAPWFIDEDGDPIFDLGDIEFDDDDEDFDDDEDEDEDDDEDFDDEEDE